MITFVIAVLALLVITALFILPPLLWTKAPETRADTMDQQAENLQILRTQLAELEQERLDGQLDEADFTQAVEELKRRILEENARLETAPNKVVKGPGVGTALVALGVLIATSSLGYALLGNPKALDPSQVQQQNAPMTQEQIEGMVASLAAKVEANPEDEQGWLMLARSYKVLGRFAEAAQAYSRVEDVVNTDPGLMADYAEALAMSSGLKGKPTELTYKALAMDPDNIQALFLAGAIAMEDGKPEKAADYWEKVLPSLEPGSELHSALQASISEIRAEAAGKQKGAAKP